MSQTPIVYEASLWSKVVAYRNPRTGETTQTELTFALHPLKLMHLVSTFEPKKIKSGNPARNGQTEVTEEQQLKFVLDIAKASAGFLSDDGESWEPFEDFENKIVGQSFLTQLTASDGDRKEFAERVLLEPFRAFVNFAAADSSNDQKDVEGFRKMLTELENIFKAPEPKQETVEERRARLQAEMEALGDSSEDEA